MNLHSIRFAPGFLFLLLAIPTTSYTQARPTCRVDDLFGLFRTELTAYRRVPETTIFGLSTEDLGRDLLYYSGDDLMAARSTDNLSRTGKTEFEYRFQPSTYAVTVTESFYEGPFFPFEPFIPQERIIGAVNQSQFVVCNGALIRGEDDQAVVRHFERASEVLKKLLEDAPR